MSNTNDNLPAVRPASTGIISPFSSIESFKSAQEMLAPLMESDMVPAPYRAYNYNTKTGQWDQNPAALGNCLKAMDISSRVQRPLALVMDHMVPIGGRASWDAAYIAGEVAASGRFSALHFDEGDHGPTQAGDTKLAHNYYCTAWAIELSTNQRVSSIEITLEMAVLEGWYRRNPKYRSMPQQMLRKRATSFFGRDYVSDLLCGMPCKEELEDGIDVTTTPVAESHKAASLATAIADAKPVEQPTTPAQPITATVEPKAEPAKPATRSRRAAKEPEPPQDNSVLPPNDADCF